MAVVSDQLLTAAEYARLSEIAGFRDELIEGERVFSPSAKKAHTVVIENLEDLLKEIVVDARVARESGWYFLSDEGKENVPSPDVMVLSLEDYDATAPDDWFRGRPWFVVELISPSERKTKRMRKVGLYLDAGAVLEVVLKTQINPGTHFREGSSRTYPDWLDRVAFRSRTR